MCKNMGFFEKSAGTLQRKESAEGQGEIIRLSVDVGRQEGRRGESKPVKF